MTKQMVVEVNFTRKDGKYVAKLKALHNGSHLIEKASKNGDTPLEVFEFTNEFINKHNATNIALKRGLLEDSFAKYLTDTQNNNFYEDEKSIEGILVDSVSEENQHLLFDLNTYKLCVEDAIKQKDYKGVLYQGMLYNTSRQELYESEGLLANPYEMTIELPLSERKDFMSALMEICKEELELGAEHYSIKKYNRLVVVTKTDYKLSVNFI